MNSNLNNNTLFLLFYVDIRLAGGSDNCRGRLEIQPEPSNDYHPVCSSIAQDNEAKVICRMIPGCSSEMARRVSLNE